MDPTTLNPEELERLEAEALQKEVDRVQNEFETKEDAPTDDEEEEDPSEAVAEETSWEATRFDDFVSRAEEMKAAGNEEFKRAVAASERTEQRSLAQHAAILYLDALEFVEMEPETEMSAAQKAQRRRLVLVLQLNRSAALNKDDEWKLSLKAANAALGIESNNVKGLFRRGVALAGLRRFDDAEGDFNTALRLDPNNRDAKAKLREVAKQRKLYEQRKLDNHTGRHVDPEDSAFIFERWCPT